MDKLSSRSVDLGSIGHKPQEAVWQSWTDAYSADADEVREFQLAALKTRFDEMVGRITVLGNLAREQSLSKISRIEDGAALLFRHSAYKSYSLGLIEKNNFGRLTQWLASFTLHDLTKFDATGLESMDDWLDRLDASTPLRVLHTSGTSGKLSFLPRSTVELPLALRGWRQNFDSFGDEPQRLPAEGLGGLPMIFPGYRFGANAPNRMLDLFCAQLFGGDESKILAMIPERLSADLLSFSGRFAVAESRGDIGREQISPRILELSETAKRRQAELPVRKRRFIDTILERLRGRRVMFFGYWGMLYDLAIECKERGVTSLFAPDSLIWCSGGTKGRQFPPGYQQFITKSIGAHIQQGFGMSETVTVSPMCPHGNYHIAPCMIPYILDPRTGEQSPRTGTHTGRLGILDLLAMTYWGGTLTGDEATLSWGDTEPCPCKRKGAYMHEQIRRYSDKEGGDDKIACAGVPEALDRALDFIKDL
jgi:hypothetical protein